jgi:sortase A
VSWFFFAAGALLLAFVGAAYLDSILASRSGLDRFEQARAARVIVPPRDVPPRRAAPSATAEPDRSLWAETRVAAWKASQKEDLGLPVAVLRIPRLGLEVPVWKGTDDLTLNRGAGLIADTVLPGERGNVGIAGHRDGFFRGLKDIAVGDEIELETLTGTERYAVERTLIVRPEDVWVLGPTPEPTLTLVTCYPFYYSGSAPERFIVRAAVRRVEEARVQASR